MNIVTRHDVLIEALNNCYTEMYKKAQPSADWKTICEEFAKEDEETQKKYPLYSRYFLSQDDTREIEDAYIQNYKIENRLPDHIELLYEYMENGGTRDKYIPEHTDEHGYHPGYRGYEKVVPVKDALIEALGEFDGYLAADVKKEMAEKCLEVLKQHTDWFKEFYGSQREKSSFLMSLMASPNINAETVKEYWKTVHGKDIEIDERPYWKREEDDEENEFFENCSQDCDEEA